MKMAGLHAFSHSDDKEHVIYCAICDSAIMHNLTPTITPVLDDFEIKNIEFIVEREVTTKYKSVISNNSILREIFSRPPPFLL